MNNGSGARVPDPYRTRTRGERLRRNAYGRQHPTPPPPPLARCDVHDRPVDDESGQCAACWCHVHAAKKPCGEYEWERRP